MKPELLKDLQDVQLQIMDEIHKVCVENNIEYYIIGGTALGAVRHGGFIPWDVDIDIAMQRKDYEKFIGEVSSSLPDRYTCISWKTETEYLPPHALVALKNSVLVQKDDHLNPHVKRYGIFVDIFPLDKAPEREKLRVKQAKKIQRITQLKRRKLAVSFSVNSKLTLAGKKAIRFLLSPVSMRMLNKKLEKTMTAYDALENPSCICSMASHYSYKKQCMPKEIYGTPVLIPFAGREYYAPAQIKEYLQIIYGDYMKEPSEEDKQKMMDFFIEAKW